MYSAMFERMQIMFNMGLKVEMLVQLQPRSCDTEVLSEGVKEWRQLELLKKKNPEKTKREKKAENRTLSFPRSQESKKNQEDFQQTRLNSPLQIQWFTWRKTLIHCKDKTLRQKQISVVWAVQCSQERTVLYIGNSYSTNPWLNTGQLALLIMSQQFTCMWWTKGRTAQ